MDVQKLKKGYNGYLLSDTGRDQLLVHVEPIHPDVVAHHITYEHGIYQELPPECDSVRVIAVAANEKVQAVIVKVNGTTARPNGGTYHITISLDKSAGAKAVDSNELISNSKNWTAVDPFNIDVTPMFFPF